jgi:hypothetical protein
MTHQGRAPFAYGWYHFSAPRYSILLLVSFSLLTERPTLVILSERVARAKDLLFLLLKERPTLVILSERVARAKDLLLLCSRARDA